MEVELSGDMDRVYDSDNDRNDAGIGIAQHLTCAISFPIHEDSIAYSRVGVIERNKIVVRSLVLQAERLHYQQSPVFKIPVTDRGDHSADYFRKDHRAFSRVLIPAALHGSAPLVLRAEIEFVYNAD